MPELQALALVRVRNLVPLCHLWCFRCQFEMKERSLRQTLSLGELQRAAANENGRLSVRTALEVQSGDPYLSEQCLPLSTSDLVGFLEQLPRTSWSRHHGVNGSHGTILWHRWQ